MDLKLSEESNMDSGGASASEATSGTSTKVAADAAPSKGDAVEEVSSEVEMRECVCFFCGKKLLLRSEEEAVEHMAVCVSLQEQLNTEGDIVIPSSLQAEIDAAEEKKKKKAAS
jgi:hypothetical protein